MSNKDIRNAISNAGLRYWQVADALSMSDGAFSRKLRRELAPEEKESVLKVIRKLAKEVRERV